MDERVFSELVGKIYDAATDPAQMNRFQACSSRVRDRLKTLIAKKPAMSDFAGAQGVLGINALTANSVPGTSSK